MSSFFTGLLTVMKAINGLHELFKAFMVWYIKNEIKELHEDDRKAIRKAIDEQDQRDLERQIGNPNPGEPSGLPGTIIVDDELPNVMPTNKG